MTAIYRQGESSGGGKRKPKVGARKTENGVELMWNGKDWVKAPNHGKKEDKPTPTQNRPKRPTGATGGRGGSFYTVSGIKYDRNTGRPVVVPQNRQPVQAQDRTKKDTESEVRTLTNNNRGGSGSGSSGSSGGSSSSSSGSSSTPRRRPTGQGSQGFRMKADLGKLLKKDKTESNPAKPKSRLEKALSNVGKWEEPKPKRKPNKRNRDKWVNR